MGLETGTYISDLVITNPSPTDVKGQGDDHLRLVKSTIKATFPNITGQVTPTHTELNYVDGVTSAIQTQLDAITTLTSGKIYIGNGSNVATETTLTGDVTMTNAGVTSISPGVIVNADINASAAIAVSKLAALTASKMVVSDSSGFLSTESPASSAAASGYFTLPAVLGSFVVQWGIHSPIAQTNYTVTFPLSFPTACYAVSLTAGQTTAGSPTGPLLVGAPTQADFTYRANNGNQTGAYTFYIAIGK